MSGGINLVVLKQPGANVVRRSTASRPACRNTRLPDPARP